MFASIFGSIFRLIPRWILRSILGPVLGAIAALLLSACALIPVVTGVPKAAGTRELKDLRYVHSADADERERLDLYVPPGAGPHPVVVFVHGGSWYSGGRNEEFGIYRMLGRRMAAHGIAAVVISYRLTPPHRHPAQVEDVARAVAWTLANVRHFGGDPSRVFLMGHSSGAQIGVLAVCDRRWLRGVHVDPTALAGVIAISGPYDVPELAEDDGSRETVTDAFTADRAIWEDASVFNHLEPGALPPFWLINAGDDLAHLQSEADRLADGLRTLGADVATDVIPDRNHYSILLRLIETGDPLAERIWRTVRARRTTGVHRL